MCYCKYKLNLKNLDEEAFLSCLKKKNTDSTDGVFLQLEASSFYWLIKIPIEPSVTNAIN